MSHYLKILFSALFVFSTLSLSANAAIENTTAVASSACNATGNICPRGWKIVESRHQLLPHRFTKLGYAPRTRMVRRKQAQHLTHQLVL